MSNFIINPYIMAGSIDYTQEVITGYSGVVDEAYNENQSYVIYIANTSSVLYNYALSNVQFNMYRESALTDGNVSCNLYNSDNSIKQQIWSIPVTDIPTSADWVNPTSQTPVPAADMAAGRGVGFQYDGTSTGVLFNAWNSSDVFDGVNTTWANSYWQIATLNSFPTRDMVFRVSNA